MSVNHIYINAEKKRDYQLAIQYDPLLCALADIIIAGWPDDIEDVPKALWLYHEQCDSLTVEDGLILCGEAIIVPPGEKKKVLEQIHLGHRNIKVPVQSKTVCLLTKHQQKHQMACWSPTSKTSTSGAKATTKAKTTTWATHGGT